MIKIKRMTWQKAHAFKNDWNNLLLKDGQAGNGATLPTIFQTFEWNQTWWRAFGNTDHELLLLFAFKENQLVGVAPLMIKNQTGLIPNKTLYWIGASDVSSASDFCSFIIAQDYDEISHALLQWLQSNTHFWDEIHFRNIPEDSNDIRSLKKYFTSKSSLLFEQNAVLERLDKTDTISKLSEIFRKRQKKMDKLGTISQHCWHNADDISPHLEEFFKQHIARRSKTPYPSFFEEACYQNYFRMLVNTLSSMGCIHLFATNLNGQTIAYYLTFTFQDKLYLYTPTFDIQWMNYSPGSIQILSLFDYALKEGLHEVNFGAGGESYKYQYANNTIKLYQFRAFKSWPRFIVFKSDSIFRQLVRPILKPFRIIFKKLNGM